MKPQFHQRAISWLLYFLLGIVAVGSFLDALNNAFTLITPSVTYAGSVVIITIWLATEVFLKKYGILWVLKGGQEVRLQRLGIRPRLALLGVLSLLWCSWAVTKTTPVTSELNEKAPQSQEKLSQKIAIFVADFQEPNPSEYGITQIIFEQLEDATKSYFDVEVKRLNQTINSNQTANIEGNKNNATIVLWGSALVNKKLARVTAHFSVIQKPMDLKIIKERETLTIPVTRLEDFTIQEDLSSKMTYLVLLTIGLARYEAQDYDGAIARLTDALNIGAVPSSIVNAADIHFFRGTARYIKGDVNLALADFDRAITLDPNEPDVYINRGRVYQDKKQFTLALADYGRSLALRANPLAYLNRGSAFLDSGDFVSARNDFTSAITLEPSGYHGYFNRGLAFSKMLDFGKAISDYTKTITLKPDFGLAFYNRGFAYAQTGQFDSAITDFTQSIAVDPSDHISYANRGVAHLAKGQTDEALLDFDRAIAIKPDYALAYYNRGLAYHNRGNALAHKGDQDQALADIDRAIRLKPDYVDAYCLRGKIYGGKGLLDKAFADLNQAINLNPKYGEAYYLRALAYIDKGDNRHASLDLKKALHLAKDPYIIERANKLLLGGGEE